MRFFVSCTNLLFTLRKQIYKRAFSVVPFFESGSVDVRLHYSAFIETLKESPTLEIKKWPQSPCLTNQFTVFSIDSIVQKLNSALGASVWVAEGHIELSSSCVNSGLPASCAHTPPLLLLPEPSFHLAMESSIQTRSRSFVRE
jgi:hypothetical protein